MTRPGSGFQYGGSQSLDRRYALASDSHRARIASNANQTISTSTLTTIVYGVTTFDPAGLKVGNTLVAKQQGVYVIWTELFWDVNATGTRVALILVNGNDVGSDQRNAVTTAAAGTRQQSTTIMQIATGDIISVQGFQSSGGNLNALSGSCILALAQTSG